MVGRIWRWVNMLIILFKLLFLFLVLTCALCRSLSVLIRSILLIVSSGIRGRFAVN